MSILRSEIFDSKAQQISFLPGASTLYPKLKIELAEISVAKDEPFYLVYVKYMNFLQIIRTSSKSELSS